MFQWQLLIILKMNFSPLHDLVPYSSAKPVVSVRNASQLPVRHDTYHPVPKPQIIYYESRISPPPVEKYYHPQVYTAERDLRSLGEPKTGILIDLYA